MCTRCITKRLVKKPWYFCRKSLDTPPRQITDRYLEPTCLEAVAEDLLEARNVVKVHEGVVLSWNISVRGLATAECSPRLELVVQPVLFATTEGDGVEYINRR